MHDWVQQVHLTDILQGNSWKGKHGKVNIAVRGDGSKDHRVSRALSTAMSMGAQRPLILQQTVPSSFFQ